MVHNVWDTRSLMFQVTSSRKRKRVGESLYVYEEEEEATFPRSTQKYLSLLHTYLLALAIAGSGKAPGAPQSPEGLGSNPTDYVMAPWDILEAYYWRAVRASHKQPEATRLAWLEKTDIAERAMWVSKFRDSNSTIGKVIQEVSMQRDAHWEAPPSAARSEPSGHGAPPAEAGRQTQPPLPPPPPQGATKKPQVGSVQPVLKDGKKLCPDFQRGACSKKGASCPKGLHRCGRVTSRGRVCGMPHHGASACRSR